ncbi:major facilitator superfamily domain-containing protein [Endogone sp. FLAS-F59071]|nr:major facilitator superfamily domain-containing protein [Endogone sp. FLAS-F59071]|eukprot:RUS18529.1 major facilitator superfamily domain-containing protein [Endogone sp. FLAS-F59071]
MPVRPYRCGYRVTSYFTRIFVHHRKQCVAIILPRVQQHFSIPDHLVGLLSSSIFAGMTLGAIFWGVLSDTRGRKLAFNWTLGITATFGLLSSVAPGFVSLCAMLFCLGFGVGGNMPVDGALFLEFIPTEHQYLLTFMSVFFSLGAVLSSFLAFLILPSHSCQLPNTCDPAVENNGWRFLLLTLGFLTLAMVLARLIFFRLQESPRYLLASRRKRDALMVLRTIIRINGSDLVIDTKDLPDPFDLPPPRSNPSTSTTADLHSHDPFDSVEGELDVNTDSPILSPDLKPINFGSVSPSDSTARVLGARLRGLFSLRALRPLFVPRWRRTTLLVFGIWALTSMGFTMFNVFLPKYLEQIGEGGEQDDSGSILSGKVYWEFLVYSAAGVPGSLLASYLVETGLGRRGTMILSSLGSALSLLLFSTGLHPATASALLSFLATVLYAVIYGYTPEVFDTRLRGTATGAASALGRIAGIASPMVSGWLLAAAGGRLWVPLYASAVAFVGVAACVSGLAIETKGRSVK